MSTFPWHRVQVVAMVAFPLVVAVAPDMDIWSAFIIGAGWMVAITDTIRHYGGTR